MIGAMAARKKRIAFAGVGTALCLLIAAAGILSLPAAPRPLPSFREVREAHRPSEAILLDRHGEVLHELRVDPTRRRLDWSGLPDISPSLRKAVIASEDRRFLSHHGVDWVSLGHALCKGLFAARPRGASTISMQLVSLLGGTLRAKRLHRTLRQKWEQIKAAQALERRWTKEQILEAYLNLVSFRGELQGVSSAARGLFGKEPSGLDEAESLLLASLIRGPNAPTADVVRRAVLLARPLGWHVSSQEVEAIAGKLSTPYAVRPRSGMAPHVARLLLRNGGEKVRCTLDAGLQKFATESLARQLASLRSQNACDGAVLVVANRTGEILAYVGNTGSTASASFVDGIIARRQAGSTLKPFLYGLAIEQRLLTAASLLDDSPLDVPTETGLYVPKNYDRGFRGLVTVRTGLSSSLNVPAVRTLKLVGTDVFVRRLADFGFEDLREGEDYGFSLALGSADVTLYELVNAYRTLATGGRWSEPTLLPRDGKPPSKQAISKEAAFIVSDILSDRGARAVTFGLENPLSTPYWAAVKTGTSKDMRDNWCIGYSKKFTVGVWVGNFSGQPMRNVSGISGTAPVWEEIMDKLHHGAPADPPVPPPALVARRISFPEGMEPERTEWFLPGTEPALPILERAMDFSPHIAYPAPGTIVALDPDIPEGRQAMFFEAQPAARGLSWVLNGEKVGSADVSTPWTPRPGKYTLTLVDAKGIPLDAVYFSVRGALLHQSW
jgi:penicillin-binding protein 1C